MSIFIVQLGTPRKRCEGLRLNIAPYPFERFYCYDVWFPNLAPSAGMVVEVELQQLSDECWWATFKRRFRREMSEPDQSRELDLLAALSHQTNLSLGCYCDDESHCHRSVLRELLAERGADVV